VVANIRKSFFLTRMALKNTMKKTITYNETNRVMRQVLTLNLMMLFIVSGTGYADQKTRLRETGGARISIAVDLNRDGKITQGSTQTGSPDATSIDKPYKFWINNDSEGLFEGAKSDVDPADFEPDNIDNLINGLRDLEDFSGLSLFLAGSPTSDQEIWIEAGPEIEINLFEGVWDNRLDYLKDENIAIQQFVSPHIGRLAPNGAILIPNSMFKNNRLNIIFEGITETSGQNSNGSYVKAVIKQDGKVIGEDKAYLSLKDIKNYYEHFTVGDTDEPEAPIFNIAQQINTNFLAPGLAVEGAEDQYVLFVHGWRMQPWERRAFAETAMKRMFWQGYKGRFGFFSWPTEFIDKNLVLTEPSNYDRSEVQARRSGSRLRALVDNGALNPFKGSLRVFAHSMGNVVVGESLRGYTGGVLYNTYIPTQAATSAQAYVNEPDRDNFEADWHLANTTNDIPPNRYLFDVPNPHTETPSANWGPRYYDGISNSVQSITNFYNVTDDALGDNLINQATKPDAGFSESWEYERETVIVLDPGGAVTRFRDRYFRNPIGPERIEIFWNGGVIQEGVIGSAEILSRITPSRSIALGASSRNEVEISSNLNLNDAQLNFGGIHSAQFLDDASARQCYWERLLTTFGFENIYSCTNQ